MKDKIQKEITECIINNNFNGLFEAAMRSGKTKIIIDALKSFKGNNILWITNSTNQRDVDIPSELKKWKNTAKNLNIICYQSIKNITKFYDLIILDECQDLTINHVNYLKNHYKNILACTGTIPNKKTKLDLYKLLNLKIIYRLSVDEAVENKLIANYKIEIWNHKLNNIDKNVKIEWKKNNEIKSFYTTEQERYNYLSRRLAELIDLRKDTKFAAINRLKYIANTKTKLDIVTSYLSNNPDKRILIFCDNIEQAEKITLLTYHSKTDDSCLKAFKDGDINHLSTVNKVNTGETFTNLDEIIIIASDSSNVKTVQRIGRSLMFKHGYTAKIIILCAYETKEKEWLDKALLDLSNDNIVNIWL